jgi:hypothetical protein
MLLSSFYFKVTLPFLSLCCWTPAAAMAAVRWRSELPPFLLRPSRVAHRPVTTEHHLSERPCRGAPVPHGTTEQLPPACMRPGRVHARPGDSVHLRWSRDHPRVRLRPWVLPRHFAAAGDLHVGRSSAPIEERPRGRQTLIVVSPSDQTAVTDWFGGGCCSCGASGGVSGGGCRRQRRVWRQGPATAAHLEEGRLAAATPSRSSGQGPPTLRCTWPPRFRAGRWVEHV